MELIVKEDFQEKGYTIIKNFFDEETITNWENTIISFYSLQAKKMGFQKSLDSTPNLIDDLMMFLEDKSQEAAFQANLQISESLGAKQLVTYPKFLQVYSELLNQNDENMIVFFNPFVLVQLPNSKRLLYHWHSEAHSYPKRKNFVNIWFPTFSDKTEKNGTMWFSEGSHKKEVWDFVEYAGYDEESLNKKNYFTHREILEEELKDYKKVPVIAKRKDLVIFDRNLIHSGSFNSTDKISYATSFRIYNIQNDFTLSGDMSVKPFTKNDLGYPNMRIS